MDKNTDMTAAQVAPLLAGITPATRTVLRHAESPRELMARVRNEYLEMPGLSLTLRQAERMWNARPNECQHVLDELVGLGFLARTRLGAFVRADSGKAGA